MADSKHGPEATTGIETGTVPVVSEPTKTPEAQEAAIATTPAAHTASEATSTSAPAAVTNTPAVADNKPAVGSTPTSAPAATVEEVDSASAGVQGVLAPTDASLASTTAAEKTNDMSPTAPISVSYPVDDNVYILWKLAKYNGHPEIWGVPLSDPTTHVPSQIIFQKFLNANNGDFDEAKDQLIKTLEWRAKVKPLELLNKVYPKGKFEGLGFVTAYTSGDAKEVITWNIYGGVKSIDETFGDLDEFIAWRVALMELALQSLGLATATVPITETSDPYKMYQVHDYRSISFLRQSPAVKAASTETIKVFAQNYPELLKEKFFVNVPVFMGFVYSFMKLFVAANTIKKFHPMSNGGALWKEFGDSKVKGLGDMLPGAYGGKGEDLEVQGRGPALE